MNVFSADLGITSAHAQSDYKIAMPAVVKMETLSEIKDELSKIKAMVCILDVL